MGTGTGGYHKLHFQTSHSTPYIWRDWSEFMSIFWHSDCCWTRDGIKAKIWYYGKYIFWITLFYKICLHYSTDVIIQAYSIKYACECWRLHNKTHSWNTGTPRAFEHLGSIFLRRHFWKYFLQDVGNQRNLSQKHHYYQYSILLRARSVKSIFDTYNT